MTREAADRADTEVTSGSVLESVSVHAAGAVCVRRARIVLPGGASGLVRVRVTGLPLSAVGALRADVSGGAAQVVDVRPDLTARVGDDAQLPALRRVLEEAEDHEAAAQAARDRLVAEAGEVTALRAVMPQQRRGDPPRHAPVLSLLTLGEFVEDRLAAVHARLRGADDEVREAARAAEVARRRLAEASGALPVGASGAEGSALVTLDVPPKDGDEGTSLDVRVEYQVPGAAWAPVYQLRLADGMAAGTLVMRACVAQRSGEDWNGVRLSLSTADLGRRTDQPELRSLRIGRRQAAPAPAGWREPPAGLEELFAGYDAATRNRPQEPAAEAFGAAAGWEPDGDTLEIPLAVSASIPLPAPAPRAAPVVAAYGGPVPSSPASPSGPPPGSLPRLAGRSRGAGGVMGLSQALFDEAAEASRGSVESSAPSAPAGPGEDLLDYAALTLGLPGDPGGRGRLRARPAGVGAVAEEMRRRAEVVQQLPLPAYAAHVRGSAGSYDYLFEAAATVDVEADGVWHTVPVCEVPVGLEPGFVCVPSLDEAVFGTVAVRNASPHALLAGPADVTVDGEFLMTVPLPTLAPGATQSVGVGVVESVRAVRRTHMKESTAGLRGGTTVLDHTVEVDVANKLGRAVTVEVRERVPVSQDRDVRIEEHRGKPSWEPDTRTDPGYVAGARVWRVRVEPGTTAQLRGGYTIRIPAGKTILGGNRRT